MAASKSRRRGELVEEGALYDLERLQKRHDSVPRKSSEIGRPLEFMVREEKEQQAREEREITELKRKVQVLKRKRSKLMQQKENSPGNLVQQFIDTCMAPDDIEARQAAIDALSTQEKEEILKAAYTLRKRKLSELCNTYRLPGLSIASEENKKICFRLDTFLNITKHTVPYFIPIKQIAEEKLNSDIKAFFSEVGLYLNALVSRREQVTLLKRESNLQLLSDVTSSPAFDLIQFTVKSPDHQPDATVKLTYENLRHSLPETVDIHYTGEENESALLNTRQIANFKTMMIDVAVREMVAEPS